MRGTGPHSGVYMWEKIKHGYTEVQGVCMLAKKAKRSTMASLSKNSIQIWAFLPQEIEKIIHNAWCKSRPHFKWSQDN